MIKHGDKKYPRPRIPCECGIDKILCWGPLHPEGYLRHVSSTNCSNTYYGESDEHFLAKKLLTEFLNKNGKVVSYIKKCQCCENVVIFDVNNIVIYKEEQSHRYNDSICRYDIAGLNLNGEPIFGIEIYRSHLAEQTEVRNNLPWVEIKASEIIEKLDTKNQPRKINLEDILCLKDNQRKLNLTNLMCFKKNLSNLIHLKIIEIKNNTPKKIICKQCKKAQSLSEFALNNEYCNSCLKQCENCKIYTEQKLYYSQYCWSCYYVKYRDCQHCCKNLKIELFNLNRHYCDPCYATNYLECKYCNNVKHKRNFNNSEIFCDKCFVENLKKCLECQIITDLKQFKNNICITCYNEKLCKCDTPQINDYKCQDTNCHYFNNEIKRMCFDCAKNKSKLPSQSKCKNCFKYYI